MANFNPTIITDSGLSLIAKISSGSGQMSFTRICTSKSSYSVDEAQHLSALTTVEQETTIDKVEIINDTAVKVSAVITNKLLESGYYINAIGLYAEDPDLGEILYSITIAKVPDWMQPDSGSGVSSLLIQLITQVSNSSNVKTELNPSVLVTVQDLLDHTNNTTVHVTAEEKAVWNGKAELSDIPTTLPANGGNADTLDELHANDFAQMRGDIADCDDAIAFGTYNITPETKNAPTADYYHLVVEPAANGAWIKQTAVLCNADAPLINSFTRININGTLSAWSNIADGGNALTATYASYANYAGTLANTASNICLRSLSSGTAAANTTNCPVGAWYGQYEEV